MSTESCSGCTRRTVLTGGAALGAVGLLAACGGGGSTAAASAAPSATGSGAEGPGSVITELAALKDKGAVAFTTSDGAGAIAISLGDEVHAFTSTCTHQGCTVGYNAGAKLVQCPCHGSRYDPTSGAVIRGPAPKALTPVPVMVDTAAGVLRRA